MNRRWLALVPVLALLAIGVYFWLRQAPQQLPPPIQVASAPAIAPSPAAAPPEPAINHPVAAPPGMTDLPPLDQADNFVKERMTELLGAKAVLTYLQIDNFVRRVVATVDNLARYAPFVALVDSVDSVRAVALYRRLYPLFQSAYESLGYPGKYFSDRLIAVIDLLLATPEPTGALQVGVPEIRGLLKPARPWVLYQFSDPALERLSSGQKILLRVGSENEKRLKSKLAEIRKLIVEDKASR